MGDLGGRVDPSKGPESRDATGGSDDYLGCGRDDLEVCVELGGGGVCRHFVRGSSLGDGFVREGPLFSPQCTGDNGVGVGETTPGGGLSLGLLECQQWDPEPSEVVKEPGEPVLEGVLLGDGGIGVGEWCPGEAGTRCPRPGLLPPSRIPTSISPVPFLFHISFSCGFLSFPLAVFFSTWDMSVVSEYELWAR